MSARSSKLVVRQHRPRRARFIWAAVLGAGLVGSVVLFEFGRQRGGFDRAAAEAQRAQFIVEIDALQSRNAELTDRIALLDRSTHIDREAYEQVEASLADLQDEILELRQELAFYRGIVSPADGRSGLRIQDFSVSQGPESSSYRVHLVLIQAMKHDRQVKGVVDLAVYGELEGKPVTFRLPELIVDNGQGSRLAFAFRYFQDFDMDLVLPDGFTPQRVEIEVTPEGRSAKVIRQTTEWAVQIS